MKKLKGIAIENDFDIPGSLKGFIKDNPDLFEGEVSIVSHARHRPESILMALQKGANAIIVSSTFMYKDQLEDSVNLFNKSDIPFTFFIEMGVQMLNKFLESRNGKPTAYGFQDYDAFIQIVKTWVKQGLVFDIGHDVFAKDTIFDEYHGYEFDIGVKRKRTPWIAEKVFYSEKYNLFYGENDKEESCADEVKWIHG
jgi:hypothetical protein